MNDNSIKNEIIDEIKTNKIKMKPKSYFALRVLFSLLILMIVFLIVIFLASFIVFALNVNGGLLAVGFGLRGISPLFVSFPWLILLFAGLLIILLEILLNHFSFAYRRPLIYSFMGILVLVISVSIVVEKTPFHARLLDSAEKGNLPAIGKFYRQYTNMPLPNIHAGEVKTVNEQEIKIQKPNGEEITITVPLAGKSKVIQQIQKGDTIMLVGERKNSHVQAVRMKKIDHDCEFYMHQERREK